MKQFQIKIPVYNLWDTKKFESISIAMDYAKTLCYQHSTDWVRVYYGEDFAEYVDVTCC